MGSIGLKKTENGEGKMTKTKFKLINITLNEIGKNETFTYPEIALTTKNNQFVRLKNGKFFKIIKIYQDMT